MQPELPRNISTSLEVAPSPDEAAAQLPEARKDTGTLYFSPALNLHVSLKPLCVEDRVIEAARRMNLTLDWDDRGQVRNISFADARRLLDELGSHMLSPREYWTLYQELAANGDRERLSMLASDAATEWLDAVFIRDEVGQLKMIEHPQVQSGTGDQFSGKVIDPQQPEGKPGWFRPLKNTHPDTGMPLEVSLKREPDQHAGANSQWKYWATPESECPLAAIRGYVTSSGTPSLDLGIPASAVAPVLTIRECRAQPLEPAIDRKLLDSFAPLQSAYLGTRALRPGAKAPALHEKFYARLPDVCAFMEVFGEALRTQRGSKMREIRETLADMSGTLRLEAERRGDSRGGDALLAASRSIYPLQDSQLDIAAFRKFVNDSRTRLFSAAHSSEPVTFVMGHKNPDTDTAISALIEAWRSALADPLTTYIPVMQTARIPDEIAALLGPETCVSYVLSSEPLYQELKRSGRSRWILVDQNVSEEQRFAVGIIDHHILSANAESQDVAKTWEMMGSCSAQVAQKLFGIGVTPNEEVARLLYGATLMDTENRNEFKMTYRDQLIMDRLKELSGVQSDDALFHGLMGALLGSKDSALLFERDYKQDWGTFGFAVAKVKGCFAADGSCTQQQLLEELLSAAEANNKAKNFPLTMLKLVNYEQDNESVERERMYLVFNDYALPEFKEAMFSAIETLASHYLGSGTGLRRLDNAVEYVGDGMQLSRKVIAPVFEQLVKHYNEYFYSKDTGLYVSRDFLRTSPEVCAAAQELGIELSTNTDGLVNYISFEDAKRLVAHLGFSMLSLSEYWKVFHEAHAVRDEQMRGHLRSPGFVEYLDTAIIENRLVIDHPRVSGTGKDLEIRGRRRKAEILAGVPGLIRPEEIDHKTGLPKKIHQPNQYGDRTLWRYWSPDADLVVPTRGHIFLYGQSALDMKVHPGERFANLGIRVCTRKAKAPPVKLKLQGGVWRLSPTVD